MLARVYITFFQPPLSTTRYPSQLTCHGLDMLVSLLVHMTLSALVVMTYTSLAILNGHLIK